MSDDEGFLEKRARDIKAGIVKPSFDEVFLGKKEEKIDTIEPLISEMYDHSENMEFEEAKDTLDEIKSELDLESSRQIGTKYNIQTVKDVSDMIRSPDIRLNPSYYNFSDYLGLVESLHKRVDELQGGRYSDRDKRRKVVAEEMVCQGITIPRHKKGMGKKPNRRFLDIADTINPSIACRELERRETVMLWKAIEKGDNEEVSRVTKKIRKFKQFED